ncbi:hypothetical protein GCK32_011985 [Trichostrongylus colubriformis]|uniref:Uncharacterized protein n=1 Tax=Trichostrongylus colubriformis TaxID=6319 RepID=A0AAN8FZF2_TRICO
MKIQLGSTVAAEDSSVADSQPSEEVYEGTLETAKEDSNDDDELDFMPLNYDATTASKNPVPEISKLDLSLLSPQVEVRREITTKPPISTCTQRTMALPDWMRLLPLEETSSSTRLPLLQYTPPRQREWKTERYTQTRAFSSGVTEIACQTAEDERNPPDSGFLEVAEKSPGKKIEIIQPMSRENIREMLSQM